MLQEKAQNIMKQATLTSSVPPVSGRTTEIINPAGTSVSVVAVASPEGTNKATPTGAPGTYKQQQQQQQHFPHPMLSPIFYQGSPPYPYAQQFYQQDGEGELDEEEEEEEEEGDYEDDEEDDAYLNDGVEVPLSARGEPKGPPLACLFIASLSTTTTEETLLNFFSQYGRILKIKLLKDRSARPYAFIQYASVEESDLAMDSTRGKALDGRKLRVEKAKVNRTLFIAKISQMTSTQLREIAEAYGPVESVTIIKNHQTNKSKGCGFVKYVFREDAMESFLGLKNTQKKWIVEWATSTNDPDQLGIDKNNIFVGGLHPLLVTKELATDKFSSYGPIENITFVNRSSAIENGDDTKSSFAFIRYVDPASSAQAIEHENGTEWFERRIRVQYCESQEMKLKKRENKMISAMNQYYRAPSSYMQPLYMEPPYVDYGYSYPVLFPNGQVPYIYPVGSPPFITSMPSPFNQSLSRNASPQGELLSADAYDLIANSPLISPSPSPTTNTTTNDAEPVYN